MLQFLVLIPSTIFFHFHLTCQNHHPSSTLLHSDGLFILLVSVHVFAQIDLLLEVFRAHGATKRLETLVFAAMGDQVGRLTERLTAKVAPMRLLARMCVRVFPHIGLLMEALPAERAGERSNVRMDHHVSRQRR